MVEPNRVRVLGAARPGGRVARMSNRQLPAQPRQVAFMEDLADQPHPRQVVGCARERADVLFDNP